VLSGSSSFFSNNAVQAGKYFLLGSTGRVMPRRIFRTRQQVAQSPLL
jgi:hypothetical protein